MWTRWFFSFRSRFVRSRLFSLPGPGGILQPVSGGGDGYDQNFFIWQNAVQGKSKIDIQSDPLKYRSVGIRFNVDEMAGIALVTNWRRGRLRAIGRTFHLQQIDKKG
jgi:hypothetical protein